MKKTFKRVTTILATLLLLVALGTQALASTIISGVPSYKQERSNWCWVACSAMVGRFYYSYSYTNQSDICKNVKGSVINVTGSASDEIAAIRYATKNRSPAPISYSVKAGYSVSYNFVNSEIGQRQPMIANMKDIASSAAHAYTVIGSGNVAGVGSQCMVMIDPSDGVWVSAAWDDLYNGNWKVWTLQPGELLYNAG